MTLDERIRMDLTEVYEGRELSGAKALSSCISVSTLGLPQHFVGDRNARTVMVMLNPGKDVQKADWERRQNTDRAREFNRTDPGSFIQSYVDFLTNYGRHDRARMDTFDLKQAHFLKHWQDSGITLPTDYMQDKEKKLAAKEAVLMQKLQLELVPYCSRSFDFRKSWTNRFFGYVETLLGEIFAVERKYVIFAARIFEDLFRRYNAEAGKTVADLSEKKTGHQLGSFKGWCRPVTLSWEGSELRAVIAYTFASQALPNAVDLMESYGTFCFSRFMA